MSDIGVPTSGRLCDCCHGPASGGGTTPDGQRLCGVCWSRGPALPTFLRGAAVREVDLEGQARELDAASLGLGGPAAAK
jgi:hypothetical protein